MNIRARSTAAVVVAASLLLFAGCTSSEPVADDTSSQTDDTTIETDAASDDTDADADADADAAADASPAGGAVYTDPAVDSASVTVSPSGFDPAAISVPVGGTVTFMGGDDGPHGIYVGDLDGYSVMGGLTATFRFDLAGTYTVYDEISEASATVTVG
ncbi:hypothetical protein [Microbacterium sp.]|uniref:cupredoxin domain-containing protein n=1 Tax=Microbacterium sp. TaxID=51671 RepID=UPI0025E11995|nr:hypothetical protein [Microbacterium sp.]